MRVGDWIIAIGNPFGLGSTVTAGIVSARSRDIRAGPYDDFLQVDAPINRGNSGGPSFNLDGAVIGINTAIFSPSGGNVGIGFAIPSNLALPVIESLKQDGRVKRGWLGVRIQTVTEEIAESLGLDETAGALVASVTPGGPAEAAKIEPGDVILEFDRKKIDRMRGLPRIVAETPIGKKVEVSIWRRGEEKMVEVELGELPEEDELAALTESGADMPSAQIEIARRDRRDDNRGIADTLRAGRGRQWGPDRRGGGRQPGGHREPASGRRHRRGRPGRGELAAGGEPPRSTGPAGEQEVGPAADRSAGRSSVRGPAFSRGRRWGPHPKEAVGRPPEGGGEGVQ